MSFLTVRLPKDAQVMVKVGQKVAAGDPLAKSLDTQRRSLPIARLLKVKPQRVKRLLTKKIGEEVKIGEILAQKTSLFAKTGLKSPVSGTLENFEEGSGILTLKTTLEDLVLKAKVSGQVIKIKEGEELILEFSGAVIEAEKGIGVLKEGLIHVLKVPKARLFDLGSDLAGKIVAAASWTREALSKVGAVGATAVLGQETEEEEWPPSKDFTFLLFSPANFEKVLKYEGERARAWGEEKILVIGN